MMMYIAIFVGITAEVSLKSSAVFVDFYENLLFAFGWCRRKLKVLIGIFLQMGE